jgi:hypothetical protein
MILSQLTQNQTSILYKQNYSDRFIQITIIKLRFEEVLQCDHQDKKKQK